MKSYPQNLNKEQPIKLILGNANKRFSGVTSTMLQVLEYQRNLVDLAILGSSHVPDNIKTIRFKEFILLCKTPLSEGKDRVFHARRNDEMLQALIAKKIFGAKIKIAFTSTGQRYHSKFTRYLMSQMDGIISTNQKAAAYLIDKPADIIVPHGVDTSTFYPSKDRKKAWQSLNLPGEFGIGVFGRVRKSKGIDILVEASLPLLEKYTEATIVICGQCLEKDAPFQEQLKEKIAQAGLSKRYVFLGEQPFKRIPELFRAMTIVTALSREEGYGLTPLEAMASGCAVLTSEAGAWKDIIRNDREGYCIATESITETREKLALLIANKKKTEEMGRSGREYVLEKYDIKIEAQALTQYLLSL